MYTWLTNVFLAPSYYKIQLKKWHTLLLKRQEAFKMNKPKNLLRRAEICFHLSLAQIVILELPQRQAIEVWQRFPLYLWLKSDLLNSCRHIAIFTIDACKHHHCNYSILRGTSLSRWIFMLASLLVALASAWSESEDWDGMEYHEIWLSPCPFILLFLGYKPHYHPTQSCPFSICLQNSAIPASFHFPGDLRASSGLLTLQVPQMSPFSQKAYHSTYLNMRTVCSYVVLFFYDIDCNTQTPLIIRGPTNILEIVPFIIEIFKLRDQTYVPTILHWQEGSALLSHLEAPHLRKLQMANNRTLYPLFLTVYHHDCLHTVCSVTAAFTDLEWCLVQRVH